MNNCRNRYQFLPISQICFTILTETMSILPSQDGQAIKQVEKVVRDLQLPVSMYKVCGNQILIIQGEKEIPETLDYQILEEKYKILQLKYEQLLGSWEKERSCNSSLKKYVEFLEKYNQELKTQIVQWINQSNNPSWKTKSNYSLEKICEIDRYTEKKTEKKQWPVYQKLRGCASCRFNPLNPRSLQKKGKHPLPTQKQKLFI